MAAERLFITGNQAVARGIVHAGCRHYFGYPITPQSEIPEYLSGVFPGMGGTFVQAESEVASINMVMGAAAGGKRSVTSSSGPGISLMQEGMSYMAGNELPCVVVNIMRCGPGLGGIAPTQGDYFQATRGGGHGDYFNIVLAPATGQEMFDFTIKCFELTDKYRNPGMVLADAMLGQMKEPVEIDPDTAVAPPAPRDYALTGAQNRKPRLIKSLYLSDGEQEEHNLELKRKYDRIRETEPMWEEWNLEDAEVLLVGFGIVSRIAKTAIRMAREQGLKAGLLRPQTLFPFPERPVADWSARIGKVLVVEMNTGQMVQDVRLSMARDAELDFVGRPGGGIPTPEEIVEKIRKIREMTHAERERDGSVRASR